MELHSDDAQEKCKRFIPPPFDIREEISIKQKSLLCVFERADKTISIKNK